MNCPNCSQPVAEGAQTCANCGASLLAGTTATSTQQQTASPAGTSAGQFAQQEEAPSALDHIKDGLSDNPIASAGKGFMDKRRQRKEEEKRQQEALDAAMLEARKQAYERLKQTCPLPLTLEKVDLPGGMELFNDEFFVLEGRDWGITTKKLIVTTKRLIHSHGLLIKDQESLDLVNVQDVYFRKSLIFHGELEIESSGGHSLEGLPRVKNGKELRNQILLMVNWAKSLPAQVVVANPTPVPQAAPTPASADKYEQLKKLADLKAAGVLSDSEFEAEKAKLLAT